MKNRPVRGKGVIKNLLTKGKKFLKDTKVISRTLDNIAGDASGNNQGLLWVKPIASLAKSYGYGARKRKVRRGRGTVMRKPMRRGKGFMDIANKVNDWLKKTKIISTIGNALAPIPGIGTVSGTIGKVAGAAGYGRKRRVRRVRRVGRGINPQMGDGYGGTSTYSSGNVSGFGMRGRKSMRGRISRRGRGIGHLNEGYKTVGIAGTNHYSSGRIQF